MVGRVSMSAVACGPRARMRHDCGCNAGVRELIKKIIRFKTVPCGLSLDGRTCCYIKKQSRLDAGPGEEQKDALQQLTVEQTVTGVRKYRFTLPGPIDCASISNDGRTITLARGMIMRVFIDGEMTFQSLKAHKASICDLKASTISPTHPCPRSHVSRPRLTN